MVIRLQVRCTVSRIGRKPLIIPENIKVSIEANSVNIEGPKGTLNQRIHPLLKVEKKGERELVVIKLEKTPAADSQQGLMRTLLANMIKGVTVGFEKVLEIHGVGYRVQAQGDKLQLQVGFSHPVEFPIPKGIEISVGKGNRIMVKGYDRRLVGETAAEIRQICPPEPYKGKGIRYLDEHVRRKAGKAAVGIGAAGGGK